MVPFSTNRQITHTVALSSRERGRADEWVVYYPNGPHHLLIYIGITTLITAVRRDLNLRPEVCNHRGRVEAACRNTRPPGNPGKAAGVHWLADHEHWRAAVGRWPLTS